MRKGKNTKRKGESFGTTKAPKIKREITVEEEGEEEIDIEAPDSGDVSFHLTDDDTEHKLDSEGEESASQQTEDTLEKPNKNSKKREERKPAEKKEEEMEEEEEEEREKRGGRVGERVLERQEEANEEDVVFMPDEDDIVYNESPPKEKEKAKGKSKSKYFKNMEEELPLFFGSQVEQADRFFEKGRITSNHTFEENAVNLLSAKEISEKSSKSIGHEKEKKQLFENLCHKFPQWKNLMRYVFFDTKKKLYFHHFLAKNWIQLDALWFRFQEISYPRFQRKLFFRCEMF